MRKILINKRGEFKYLSGANYLRGSAVKKVANTIGKASENKAKDMEVIVSKESFKKIKESVF